MTKSELRKQRQAEHAQRQTERITNGDFRNAQQRHLDEMVSKTKRRRKMSASRSYTTDSLTRTEQRGGLIGGYEED